ANANISCPNRVSILFQPIGEDQRVIVVPLAVPGGASAKCLKAPFQFTCINLRVLPLEVPTNLLLLGLRFALEDQVQDPAATNMSLLPLAMLEYPLLLASGTMKRVGKSRHPPKRLVLVNGPGQGDNICRSPLRFKRNGMKRIA